MKRTFHTPRAFRPRHQQKGLVLVYAMIALVLMLIGGAAMMRSMNTALFNAGNLGFKRDLTNQGERAIRQVVDLATNGVLATELSRQANSPAANYSAAMLATSPSSLPLALLSDAAFAGVGSTANDIVLADQGIKVRYLIDRLCIFDGIANASTCTLSNVESISGSELLNADGSNPSGPSAIKPQPIYRVSIRVTGPRNTQSFFQSTFTQ